MIFLYPLVSQIKKIQEHSSGVWFGPFSGKNTWIIEAEGLGTILWNSSISLNGMSLRFISKKWYRFARSTAWSNLEMGLSLSKVAFMRSRSVWIHAIWNFFFGIQFISRRFFFCVLFWVFFLFYCRKFHQYSDMKTFFLLSFVGSDGAKNTITVAFLSMEMVVSEKSKLLKNVFIQFFYFHFMLLVHEI